MTVPTLQWFAHLQDALNSDQEYLALGRWLLGPVLFKIGDAAFTVYFHKGRVIEVEPGAALTGTDFAIVGPDEEWARLIRGEIDLGLALTPPAGRLRIEGNGIKAAGNMRPLFRMFSMMSSIPTTEVLE